MSEIKRLTLSPAKIYCGGPPPGTPITPGTQIILSEGVAGGVTKLSLPMHPVPQQQTQQLQAQQLQLQPQSREPVKIITSPLTSSVVSRYEIFFK